MMAHFFESINVLKKSTGMFFFFFSNQASKSYMAFCISGSSNELWTVRQEKGKLYNDDITPFLFMYQSTSLVD